MEKGNIYALIFSSDTFEREALERMSDKGKYELAAISEEAAVLSLNELSYWVNNDSLQTIYLYFVEI